MLPLQEINSAARYSLNPSNPLAAFRYLDGELKQLETPDIQGVPIAQFNPENITINSNGVAHIQPTTLVNPFNLGDVMVKSEAGKLYYSADNGATWEEIGAGTGGVTDHAALTNIGTNTHAQIDAALAATPYHWALRYNNYSVPNMAFASGSIAERFSIVFDDPFTIWAVVKPVRYGFTEHILEITDANNVVALDFQMDYLWMKNTGGTPDLELWTQAPESPWIPEQWNMIGVCVDQANSRGFFTVNGVCDPFITGLSPSGIGADHCTQITIGNNFQGYIAGIAICKGIQCKPDSFFQPGARKGICSFPNALFYWDFQKDAGQPTRLIDTYAKNRNAWNSGDPAEIVPALDLYIGSSTWEIVTDL